MFNITEQDGKSLNATMQDAPRASIVVYMETTLGRLIKQRMARLGIKPREVSAALDRSESYVSMLSNDKIATPPPDVVHALAELLQVRQEVILQHMGYLAVDSPLQVDGSICIAVDDPRREILAIMEGLSNEAVESVAGVMRLVADGVRTPPAISRKESSSTGSTRSPAKQSA